MSVRRDQDGAGNNLKTNAQLTAPTTRKATESREEIERCCKKGMTI